MADWKDTCNLPRTAFSMKANLQTTEPETVARWDAMDLYGRIRAARKGATKYLLHDGPPYANGEIHMGHALNKILKDLVVKSHNMLGFDAPYIPGWDCHGLPIELKVDRELGPKKKQMSTADFRRACRAYAEKYVDLQRRDFKRLGILGTWDDPYKTLKFEYQAAIVRALGKFVEQDMVYKGKKPVHWCTHCRTALAEAEVEYEPHTSPSIYVEFPLSDESRGELAKRVPALASANTSVLIWTTTPWTIPSNLGIAFHPDFVYGAYHVDGSCSAIRCTRAIRSASSAITSRSKPAPAWSIPRPVTAPTTTRPASATASRTTRRSIRPAVSTSRSGCLPGSRSRTRIRRSNRRSRTRASSGIARTSITRIRTAGAATTR